jgi:hypothetical protein
MKYDINQQPTNWPASLMEVDAQGLIIVPAVINPGDLQNIHRLKSLRLQTLGPCPICGRVGIDPSTPYTWGHGHGHPASEPLPIPGDLEGRAGHCDIRPDYNILRIVTVEEAIKLAPRGWMRATTARADLKRRALLDFAHEHGGLFYDDEALHGLQARGFAHSGMWTHHTELASTVRLLRKLTDEGKLETVKERYRFDGPLGRQWRQAR